ncbi:hypothetical protein NSS82_19000 [Paenibacillus sp. FSL H7-0735]|uniref:hypothetical protein n=1 Tax=Paenibacillus sp. FSL H7-0735 TaxID=2954736 RepID=UPI0030FA18B3
MSEAELLLLTVIVGIIIKVTFNFLKDKGIIGKTEDIVDTFEEVLIARIGKTATTQLLYAIKLIGEEQINEYIQNYNKYNGTNFTEKSSVLIHFVQVQLNKVDIKMSDKEIDILLKMIEDEIAESIKKKAEAKIRK